MVNLHQIKGVEKQQGKGEWSIESSPQLETLAALICHAEESGGDIGPTAVLKLAAAAKEAIDLIWSDLERMNKEALQEAVLETFLDEGTA